MLKRFRSKWSRVQREYGGDTSEGFVHAGATDGTIVGAVIMAIGALWHKAWRGRE
jgi:hypothetical protein